MADEVDVTNAAMEAIGLKLPKNLFVGVSLHECEDCGSEIPENRRKLGNVKLCIQCKTIEEKRAKHYS